MDLIERIVYENSLRKIIPYIHGSKITLYSSIYRLYLLLDKISVSKKVENLLYRKVSTKVQAIFIIPDNSCLQILSYFIIRKSDT